MEILHSTKNNFKVMYIHGLEQSPKYFEKLKWKSRMQKYGFCILMLVLEKKYMQVVTHEK